MRLAIPAARPERLNRRPANSYDLLKCVAVLSMVLDHVGLYLRPDLLWLRVAGRLAFPLFLFLVGYSRHTRLAPSLWLGAMGVSLLEAGARGALVPLNILWGIALTRLYLGRVPPARARAHLLPLLLASAIALPVLAYGTMPLVFGILGAMGRERGSGSSATFRAWSLGLPAVHMLTQLASFPFSSLQAVTALTLAAILTIGFIRFRLRPVALPPGALLLSRYALEVYIIHITLLMLLSAGAG